MHDSSRDAVLVNRLACPVCHAEIEPQREADVSCLACGRRYPATGGVFDFIPHPPPDPDVAQRWALWEQLESNGRVAYENDPRNNLSVTDRDDCAAFSEFAELEGVVLDVGCGPQRLPSYARVFEGALVGIDPLLGALPRDFAFVRGIGEYLPFRSESFDRVLFATSLDHALAPARTLSEAHRVVKPSGTVALWVGEKGDGSSAPACEGGVWYEGLSVPEGAVDRFHAVRVDRTMVRDQLREADLAIDELRDDEQGNVFIRARRR